MVGTPAVPFDESPASSPPAPTVDRSRRYTRILLIVFLCTLPLVNPIVHGHGVGYYAYVRAPLIEHRLDLTQDFPQAVRLSIKSTIRYPIQSGSLESARCRWFL